MIKNNYSIIGVMSGTSLDGVDLVYAKFEYKKTWNYKIIHAETISYSKAWVNLLKSLVSKTLDELKTIDSNYTIYLAQIINDFIAKHQIKNLDAISSHGHTALHQPEKKLTYQIGNLPIIAKILNKIVVCDFRVQDVDLEGQGAPLVPIGDALLFSDYHYCLNLGGFANISYADKVRIAFDICPVNIVLNKFAEALGYKYDDGGKIAASGNYLSELEKQLSALPYYKKEPPKSLGLEWVNKNIFPIMKASKQSEKDLLKTFSDHVANKIANVINKGSKVLVTGGGAYNDYLISKIKYNTDAEIVIPSKNLIEFKEALIFAFLGVLKLRNEINCLKSVTGALKDHSSGRIHQP